MMFSKSELYWANMAFNPYIIVAALPCLLIGFLIQSLGGSNDTAFNVALFAYFAALPLTIYFGNSYADKMSGSP